MGSFTTTMGVLAVQLILAKSALESIRAVFGQSLAPHLLLLFSGGFGNSSRAVFGQFCSFLCSIWVVFRQKNNRLTAQSVIVNR